MSHFSLALTGLSFERLRSFCLIVDAGFPAEAARQNSITHPQLSRQIRDLEDVLETKLFRKEGKRLCLTKDGIRLYTLTQAYFTSLSDFRLGNAADTRPLRLGSAESVVRWLLAPRFPEVLTAAGSVVETESHRTSTIVEKLERGDLDVGIVRAGAGGEELVRLPFTTIKFVLMVPRSRLPDKSPEGITQVGTLPFILLMGDGTFVRSVERIAAQNSLALQLCARVDGFGPAIELAKTLDAATFIPVQAQGEFQLERFTPVPLVGLAQMDRELVVAYNRHTTDLNPRAQRFATRLSRAFETAVRA